MLFAVLMLKLNSLLNMDIKYLNKYFKGCFDVHHTYPNISETEKNKFRKLFNLEFDEEIYYCWSKVEKKIFSTDNYYYFLLTTKGIYQDRKFLRWEDISRVRFLGFFLVISTDTNSIFCSCHDTAWDSNIIGVATALTNVCNPNIREADELMEKREFEKAISVLKKGLNAPGIELAYHTLLLKLCEVYVRLNNFDDARKIIESNLLTTTKGTKEYYFQKILESKIYCHNNLNLPKARIAAHHILSDAAFDEEVFEEDPFDIFNNIDDLLTSNLSKIPFLQRKLIVPVKNYQNVDFGNFILIKMDKIPQIQFPLGHPIENKIYVGHPLLNQLYLPLEDYQFVLVEDRVREFCELAQCLGATEISIDCAKGSSSDQETNSNSTYSTDYQGKFSKGGVDVNVANQSKFWEELKNRIALRQSFNPTKPPYCPEGLVWYNNEPSWQRLCKQRLEGGLLYHEEKLETSKSQMIDTNELIKVKGEFKAFSRQINLAYENTEESKFQKHENVVLSIKVKFAPFGPANTQPNDTIHLSENEKCFIKAIQSSISDGIISESDRTLLSILKTQLGISDQRASELEKIHTAPKLTAEEQKYFDACKGAMQNGLIPDSSRQLLNMIRDMSGISEQRGIEIEKMI